eukprot:GHVS01065043.1.p1 GENE.GHVS01065043.1~~GHVS01065043.1.p1  ORF type:complete len:247 (-),score=48.70 GHVS01065043.1:693-1433(-)
MTSSLALISVDITHSKYAQRRWPQIRLDPAASIDDTKLRLHHHVGTSPSLMKLYGRPCQDGEWLSLGRGDWSLAEYGVESGWQLHVEDVGIGGVCDEERLLSDKSTKITMADEDYDKRPKTMRKFLAGLKGREAMEDTKGEQGPTGGEKMDVEAIGLEEAQMMFPVGNRCSIGPGDRRGIISFVGHRSKGHNVWVGICLDEPLGSTDGLENGVKLFDCDGPKYGEWAKPQFVEVGEFPPFDPFDEI